MLLIKRTPPIKFPKRRKFHPPADRKQTFPLNCETSETNMETSCKHAGMKKTSKFNVKQLKFFNLFLQNLSYIHNLYPFLAYSVFCSIHNVCKGEKKIFQQRQLKLNGLNLFENINLISLFRYFLYSSLSLRRENFLLLHK